MLCVLCAKTGCFWKHWCVDTFCHHTFITLVEACSPSCCSYYLYWRTFFFYYPNLTCCTLISIFCLNKHTMPKQSSLGQKSTNKHDPSPQYLQNHFLMCSYGNMEYVLNLTGQSLKILLNWCKKRGTACQDLVAFEVNMSGDARVGIVSCNENVDYMLFWWHDRGF